MVLFLAKDPRVKKSDLSHVKVTFCGAAPLSAELINEYKARVPGEVVQGMKTFKIHTVDAKYTQCHAKTIVLVPLVKIFIQI